MTSRPSETNYWDSQQLPQNQYHPQHYSYSSSAPSMINQQQQQQPRQPPMINSLAASESSSTYAASPSMNSNAYYGSFYSSSGQMNGGSGAVSNYNSNTMNGGGGHHPQANGNGMSSSSSSSMPPSQSNGGGHFTTSSHVSGGGHYSVNNNHSNGSSMHHLNTAPLYHRSHFGEMSGGIPQGVEEMKYHQHQNHPSSSQHSGSPTLDGSDYGLKPKRRQVKNACINCQKACKRCDEGRPCTRCVKYGLTDTCHDSSRKERKRGIKRGPYKRRATAGPPTGPSSSNPHYPQSTFMVMDGIHSAPFISHHPAHASMSPHIRSHREDHNGMGMGGEEGINENNLLSPAYPSSAPGTIQRTTAPLSSSHDGSNAPPNGFYNRDHYSSSSMQPPRYTSRYDYERNGNMTSSPVSSYYNGGGGNATRPGPLPLPVSAPPSSTNFSSSSPASGYNSSRSLFSPTPLLSNSFLSANGHHRLHSDSSVNTLNTTPGNSLSPRTPMSLSGGGGPGLIGELGLMGTQSLSANSASPGIGSKMNGQGYVHHPGPTTTSNLPPTAAGAFLNPPSAPSINAQPFPLHIPHSARWRGNSTGSNNGDQQRDGIGRSRLGDEKEEQLAPMKLHISNDSNLSAGTISNRYQLPSPRSDRGGMAKMEHSQDVMAA